MNMLCYKKQEMLSFKHLLFLGIINFFVLR